MPCQMTIEGQGLATTRRNNKRCKRKRIIRMWCPFRTPKTPLEPEDEAFYLRRAQRNLHHRSRKNRATNPQSCRSRPRDACRKAKIDSVRRNKKTSKSVVRECAEAGGEFYVCERWLGGALTNLQTIRNLSKHLERIEKRIAAGGEGFTKKEMVLMAQRPNQT